MVGGTGLYIKAFAEGMDDIPAIDPSIRLELNNKYKLKGIHWLQEMLKEKDPDFWHHLEQQNPQRLLRGLEVVLSTGKSITSFRKGLKKQRPFNRMLRARSVQPSSKFGKHFQSPFWRGRTLLLLL